MSTSSSDYSQGKIYKLYILGFEEICYVGSTVTPLNYRLDLHRHAAKTDTQTKASSSVLFEDGNEVLIELIEKFPCRSKAELETRERYWIEQYPECVNKNIPTRGWKERWNANRDHNLKKHKEWVEKNREHIKEYNQKNKDHIRELARIREADPEVKAKRAAAKKQRVTCPSCGKEMAKNSLWEHNKKIHTTPS